MPRYAWLVVGGIVLGLTAGSYMGWRAGRIGSGLPGQVIRVAQTPPYEPVLIVPDSVKWPRGPDVAVQSVAPPSKKERRKLESDFGLNPDETAVLNRFTLPPLPDGGEAVVTVPVSDSPEPVSLIVRANPPPLVRVRWEPEVQGWWGYQNGTEIGTVWAGYLQLDRLICLRDRVCLQMRSGYERRLQGSGWVAEAGVAISF